MIQTEHITKSFGRTRILSGISLHVRDRELVAYLGPNGAGKTTTVRILSGQARADGGTVKLAGRNLTEHPLEAKALCGVVSQHLNLDAELSVRENLDIHGRLFGMNASERKEGITSLLETVEMAHKVDVLTKTLSGGEKRRIMLARALLHKPRILFLDEPTVGLDPLIRRKLWGLIKRIQQEGTTILLTTHYIEEAEFLADRVIDAHDASSFFIDDGFCPRGSPISIVCQIAVIDETAFQHRYVKNFREVAAYLQDLEVRIEIQRLTFPFDFVLCIRFMGDGKYSGLCESF